MEDKVYYPEVIETYALPETVESEEAGSTNYVGKTNLTPNVKVTEKFPVKNIAREVIGVALDTKKKIILGEFIFGQVGAIAIGVYENGVSGDIRITPNGLVARDINGNTTMSLDGTTGDAVFKGSITAGSLITGAIDLGNGAIILDGANNRITMSDGTDIRLVIGSV